MRPDFYQWIEGMKISMPVAIDDKKGSLKAALQNVEKGKKRSKRDYKGAWHQDPSHALSGDLTLIGKTSDPYGDTGSHVIGRDSTKGTGKKAA